MMSSACAVPVYRLDHAPCLWEASRPANKVTRAAGVPLTVTTGAPGSPIIQLDVPPATTVQAVYWAPAESRLYGCLEDRADSGNLVINVTAWPVPAPGHGAPVMPTWTHEVVRLPLTGSWVFRDFQKILSHPTAQVVMMWPSPQGGVHLTLCLRRTADDVAALLAARVTDMAVTVYAGLPLVAAATRVLCIRGAATPVVPSVWSPPMLAIGSPPRLVSASLDMAWGLPPALWPPLLRVLKWRVRQPGLVHAILAWAATDQVLGVRATLSMTEAVEASTRAVRGTALVDKCPVLLGGMWAAIEAYMTAGCAHVDIHRLAFTRLLHTEANILSSLHARAHLDPVLANQLWTTQAVVAYVCKRWAKNIPIEWTALTMMPLPPWGPPTAVPRGIMARWLMVAHWLKTRTTPLSDVLIEEMTRVVQQAVRAIHQTAVGDPGVGAAWSLLLHVVGSRPGTVPDTLMSCVTEALQPSNDAQVPYWVLHTAAAAVGMMLTVTPFEVFRQPEAAPVPDWRQWWVSTVARVRYLAPAPATPADEARWGAHLTPSFPLTLHTARVLGEALWHVSQLQRAGDLAHWVDTWLGRVVHGLHTAAWALRHQQGLLYLDAILQPPLAEATLALCRALACPRTSVPMVAAAWAHVLSLSREANPDYMPCIYHDAILVSVASAVTGHGYDPTFDAQRPMAAWEPLHLDEGEDLFSSVHTAPLMAWWAHQLGSPRVTSAYLPPSWTHEVPAVCAAVWTGAVVCMSQWVYGHMFTSLPMATIPECVEQWATWLDDLQRTLWCDDRVTLPVLTDLINVSTNAVDAWIESTVVPELGEDQISKEALPHLRPAYGDHRLWWRAMALAVNHPRVKVNHVFYRLLQPWWDMEPIHTWSVTDIDQCVAVLSTGLALEGLWWHEILRDIDAWTQSFKYHQSPMLVYFVVALMRQVVTNPAIQTTLPDQCIVDTLFKMDQWLDGPPYGGGVPTHVRDDLRQWSRRG